MMMLNINCYCPALFSLHPLASSSLHCYSTHLSIVSSFMFFIHMCTILQYFPLLYPQFFFLVILGLISNEIQFARFRSNFNSITTIHIFVSQLDIYSMDLGSSVYRCSRFSDQDPIHRPIYCKHLNVFLKSQWLAKSTQ